MSYPVCARAPRLFVAAALCVGVAATVPALQGNAPQASASTRADTRVTQTLTAAPTPAPANAQAPVSTTTSVRATSARRAPKTPTRTTQPKVLEHAQHGSAAIKALGSRLPAAAAKVGWSPTKLRSVLSSDHTAYVSDTGRVFFREDDLTAQATATPQTATTTVAPVYPTSQTFTLHSRSSATRKIFLDFDGATVSNTGWNGTGAGKVANGSHTGFDLDGNPSTFSTAENGYIQEVWREVAEDYAPFDVDVTTQDPGVAGITRSSTSDVNFGTHVVITSEAAPRTALCGSCLGLAYVGTFDNVDANGYYQPAWVFDYDARFDPMIIAQAAAHETGHTLGLSHDGTAAHGSVAAQGYSFGTSAWGPIMGGSMNRAVSQWSQGEYAYANNHEDDLKVIANNNLPLRADDHPGTTSLGAHPSYAVSGVIGTRTDTDDFSISLPCTTTLSVNAAGIGKQTALDLSLTVLDSNGQAVATSSPASTYAGSPPVSGGMNASLSIPNATGTYTLRVDGVGNGSASGNGWSDYGSLGQYTLSSTGCAAVAAPSAAPAATPTPTPTPSTAPTTPTATPKATPTTQAHPATVVLRTPTAPRLGSVTSGEAKGAKNATVRWSAPTDTGGTAITSYSVQAQQLDSRQRVVHTYLKQGLHASTRTLVLGLPAGSYRFRVQAVNAKGASPWSAWSRTVKSQ